MRDIVERLRSYGDYEAAEEIEQLRKQLADQRSQVKQYIVALTEAGMRAEREHWELSQLRCDVKNYRALLNKLATGDLP